MADVKAAINVEGQLGDKQFLDDHEIVVKIAKKGFTNATDNALHRLRNTKPSIGTITELADSRNS